MLALEVDLLSINYMIMQGESYAKRIEELKADVRVMLDKAVCKDLEYHITLGTKYKNYETRFTETTIYRNKKVYTPWLLNLDYLDNMGMIQPQVSIRLKFL